jgi:hypothetical protein
VTAWQLLVGLVLALGGVVWAVAKADLEDPDLYRWLTRKLVNRAALRLPRGERARWREQSMRDVLDLPGRLLPLWWALDTYAKSGRWGRERGVPSRWEVLMARVRAAWQRLRSLPEEWAKARSKERHPAFSTRARVEVEAEPARAAAVALDATVTVGPAILNDRAVALDQIRITKRRASSSHLPKADRQLLGWVDDQCEDMLAWLAQQRRDFENHIDLYR